MYHSNCCNFNFCGSDVVVFSTLIGVLLAGSLSENGKDVLGNALMTMGQTLLTAEAACGPCDRIQSIKDNDGCGTPYYGGNF
jgi:hypothetical protein